MKARIVTPTIAKVIPSYRDPLAYSSRDHADSIKLNARQVFDTCLMQTKHALLLLNDQHNMYYWVSLNDVELVA